MHDVLALEVLSSSPTPTCVLDHEGCVQHSNAPFAELIGRELTGQHIGESYRELQGEGWQRLREELGSGPRRRLLRRATNAGAQEHTLVAWRLRSGFVWLSVRAGTYPERAVGAFAWAEELAQIGAWEWEIGTTEVWWSPGLYRIYGRDPRLGPPKEEWLETIHPEDREPLLEAIAAAQRAGRYEARYRVLRPDGVRWVQAHGEVRALVDGVSRLIGVAQDVTEAMRSRSALERAERRSRSVIEATGSGLLMVDRQGCIRFANRAAYSLFGFAPGELEGRGVSEIVGDVARDHHADHVAEWFRDGSRSMRGRELPARRADGSLLHVEVDLGAVTLDGGDPGALATVHDLSLRLQLESQLAQSQRLDSLGRLAGGVAHDFNNLLMAMMGGANFALENAGEPDLVRDEMTQLLATADRARSLTHQLLAFARRQALVLRPLDPNQAVREAVSLLERVLGERVQLRVELDGDAPALLGDAGQLEQILVNLAVNARDAMPQGGALWIETSLGELEGAPGVRLCVRDEGVGIPAEHVERIFDPFFTTKGDQGTGLGLSMVHGIVKQCGGRIEVESTLGEGTRITLLFPATGRPRPTSPTKARPESSGAGRRVLLVEDEPGVARVVQRALRRADYEVVWCEGVTSALIQLDERLFDILLTDVGLPDGDGVELAQGAREKQPALRVILMTGYSLRAPEVEAPFRLLHKPFHLDQLREALDSP